ncbi:MAG: MarR family transcriptional regulator [Desulfomonile tiedjei]|uniref:MarR family transcriptional regulator n=1 Tax=Desulfomonile tiedjei TaxID=2358 RepID=A0A9D6V5A1_9BACT|nr:MarR family transcriptional regulator [Desulfomonile tiedjei]
MELNERVMVFIVMASEMFKKNSSALLRQHGLTFSHYNVLKHLVACEEGRDSVGNVSKHMLVTGANVTGLAKRMEKAGLIERTNDKKDERLTVLQTTPMALKTLEAIRDTQEQHASEYLRVYAREQKEEVLSVLKYIVQRVKQSANSSFE